MDAYIYLQNELDETNKPSDNQTKILYSIYDEIMIRSEKKDS